MVRPTVTLGTARAGRWVTVWVGRWGRTVNEVAIALRFDWHTVNDAVIATAPRSLTVPRSDQRRRVRRSTALKAALGACGNARSRKRAVTWLGSAFRV